VRAFGLNLGVGVGLYIPKVETRNRELAFTMLEHATGLSLLVLTDVDKELFSFSRAQ